MSSGAFPSLPLHLKMSSSPLYKPSCCFRFSEFSSCFIDSCISRIHRRFALLISSTVRVGFVFSGSLLWFLAAFKFLINFRLRAVTLNSFVASLKCSQSVASVNFMVLIRVGSFGQINCCSCMCHILRVWFSFFKFSGTFVREFFIADCSQLRVVLLNLTRSILS